MTKLTSTHLSMHNSFNLASPSTSLLRQLGSPSIMSNDLLKDVNNGMLGQMFLADEALLGMKGTDDEKIGLNFFTMSDQLKKKILTLHSHLQFDHHPLKKVIQIFRESL